MKVNAGFYRKVAAKPGYEHLNVQGVEIPGEWADADHAALRIALREAVPKGQGWILQGYCEAPAKPVVPR